MTKTATTKTRQHLFTAALLLVQGVALTVPGLALAGWMENKSGWMEKTFAAAPQTRLRDIVIPGTHDSGTYAITSSSALDPNDSSWYYSFAKGTVADWAKTQDMRIYDQLRQGIRYLDLRVTKYNGDFWITHGMISVRLSTVLADIKQFSAEHPREILLLDFQKMPGSADHAALQAMIDSYLLDRLLPVTGSAATVTVNDFWSRNRQVMALMDSSVFTGTRPNYWYRGANLDGVWPNSPSRSTVWSANDSGLNSQDTNRFWVSQLIITGQNSDITNSALGICPCSLYDLNRREVRTGPESWLRNWISAGKKVNVVITDFANEGAVVAEAIAANFRWDAARIVAAFPDDYGQIIGVDRYSRNEESLKKVRGNWDGVYGAPQSMIANGGTTYFFFGDEYVRYNNSADRVDRGYPKPIAGYWSLPAGWGASDAAMEKGSGVGYFFKGSQYLRYNQSSDTVDAGYPKAIAGNWPGLSAAGFDSNIDAAYKNTNGKYYLFKGTQYVRIDIAAGTMDAGYPKPIAGNWGAITSPVKAAEYGVKGNAYFMLKQDGGFAGSWNNSAGLSTSGNPVIALKVDGSSTVTLNLTASVDSYLYLQDLAGNLIAQDDDSGGNGNARITRTLAPGVYRVIAATYAVGQTASFSLNTSAGTLIGE